MAASLAAIIGDQVGYGFGRRVGPALFRRPDSRFFRQEYVDRARTYFDEQGPKTIVLARFVPIVRTFAPVVAGVSRMNYRTFVTYNVVGGIVWGGRRHHRGLLPRKTIPDIDKYLLPIIVAIVAVSLIPVVLEARKQRAAGKEKR